MPLTFHRKFLPFERAVLTAVHERLAAAAAERLAAQIMAINKIQRLLEWHEVEFYSMRWFSVRWPESVLFADKSEFELGQVRITDGTVERSVKLWSVGGHVFELECREPLRVFAKAQSVIATDASVCEGSQRLATD